MIWSKYEENCARRVEEFCFITDNAYTKEEVIQCYLFEFLLIWYAYVYMKYNQWQPKRIEITASITNSAQKLVFLFDLCTIVVGRNLLLGVVSYALPRG